MEKWELIYNSGLKLFKKFWPKKVSIDMIVEEAGVGKGTFYNYYKNKEELYEEIILEIFSHAKDYANLLVEKFPDLKERLMVDFVNSLNIFCDKNSIVWNLMHNNKDYFIWKIDKNYLENRHIEMMKIFFYDFQNEFADCNTVLMDFARNLFLLYKNWVNLRDNFNSSEEFKDFMTRLAYFNIEWMFSEHFKKIDSIFYKDYQKFTKPFNNKCKKFKSY